MVKNDILRGKLLRFLYDTRPDNVEKSVFSEIYYEYYKIEAIEKELEYLVQKLCIDKTLVPHPYKAEKKVSLYKISARGIDVIEGVIAIEGVSVLIEED